MEVVPVEVEVGVLVLMIFFFLKTIALFADLRYVRQDSRFVDRQLEADSNCSRMQ